MKCSQYALFLTLSLLMASLVQAQDLTIVDTVCVSGIAMDEGMERNFYFKFTKEIYESEMEPGDFVESFLSDSIDIFYNVISREHNLGSVYVKCKTCKVRFGEIEFYPGQSLIDLYRKHPAIFAYSGLNSLTIEEINAALENLTSVAVEASYHGKLAIASLVLLKGRVDAIIIELE